MKNRAKWISGLIVFGTLPLTVPLVVSGFLIRMAALYFMAGWELAEDVNRRMLALWSK